MSKDSLLKPYLRFGVLADADSAVNGQLAVCDALAAQGFQVLGVHLVPGTDGARRVVCFTSEALTAAAADAGGMHAMASVLRVGIDHDAETRATVITATNPVYWGPAMYFKKWSETQEQVYQDVDAALAAAAQGLDLQAAEETEFGHAEGLSVKKLRTYQFMWGMPDMGDPCTVGTFESHEAGVACVTRQLEVLAAGATAVYSHQVSDSLHVFGFGMGDATTGEAHFLPIIDKEPGALHTPAFPYELVVVGNKAFIPHGRFRIAVAFPALTMVTFSKIMGTPGSIEDTATALCKA